jgi:hypothetical protein
MRWEKLALCAALVAVAPLARAASAPSAANEQLTAARALADAGLQLFEQGDYATALERFRSAEQIVHAPPHLLFMAKAQAKLGRLLEARKLYEQLGTEKIAAHSPDAFREAQREGATDLAALKPRIPSLRIALRGAGAELATVAIDGAPVERSALAGPIEVDPGSRKVVATVVGQPGAERTVEAPEGAGVVEVELALGASGASAAGDGGATPAGDVTDAGDTGPALAGPLAVMGVGVAALGVGIVTGVLTLNDAAELKELCPTSPCSPDNESLADTVNTLGNVSTVAFVVGGAAAGAGLLWLFLQPTDGEEAGPDAEPEGSESTALRVEPWVGPTFAGMKGSF